MMIYIYDVEFDKLVIDELNLGSFFYACVPA